MKTQRNRNLPITAASFLSALILMCAACESPVTPNGLDETAAIQRVDAAPGNTAYFNPQPEPPARIFDFVARGRRGGRWFGQYYSSSKKGQLNVKTLSSKKRGRTVHLTQLWILHPPEPVHPVKSNHSLKTRTSVKIIFKGVLNSANGTIVLKGYVKKGERNKKRVKVRMKGQFRLTGRGMILAGGQLMFNPQPEPPAVGRNMEQ